jgi:hypothetical protein
MFKRYLYLTGGLGNQLFQFAALQSNNDSRALIIDAVNGSPRTNLFGEPDILDFELPGSPIIHKRKMINFTRRAIGFNLRLHINSKSTRYHNFLCLLTRFATSILVSLHFREIVFVRVLEDLGDDNKSDSVKVNLFLIGYFQSIRWAETMIDGRVPMITLRSTSSKVQDYKKLAEREKPLVVHIRLGDYVSESGFGIPSEKYYSEAISNQLSLNRYEKIWLFSDEPKKAIKKLPVNSGIEYRIIEQAGLSSAETLEIMRFGHGYVIANSSFSYWGAFLSYSEDPKVICPHPWFKDLASPNNLIPEEWSRADARF